MDRPKNDPDEPLSGALPLPLADDDRSAFCMFHLQRMVAADTVEALWSVHRDCMAAFGFDRLTFALGSAPQGPSFSTMGDLLLLTSHDTTYAAQFLRPGHFRQTPMASWLRWNFGARSFCHANQMRRANRLTPAEQQALEIKETLGLKAGYVIRLRCQPLHLAGVVSLSASDGVPQAEVDRLWQAQGDDIILLNEVMQMRMSTLPLQTKGRPMSARQRQALGWIGSGKSVQDVAQIMGIAPATVEKHLRLAREALGVETTAHAVLKASFLNQLITLAEDH